MNGRARCHNGNRSVGDAAYRFTRSRGCVIEREQISDGEHLGGEKAIESTEAEGAAAAKEIGDMRGLETCLAGKESSIHTASIDPPEEFQAETLLQLGEVHCGKTVAWLEDRQAAMTGDVARIVATVDATADARQRELERKLEAAEQQIAELKAQAAGSSGRKTLPVATMQLLAKQGIGSVDGLDAGSLDAALTGLSLEQRVAVKAQLIRSGALA
jgi:hypothetical protein